MKLSYKLFIILSFILVLASSNVAADTLELITPQNNTYYRGTNFTFFEDPGIDVLLATTTYFNHSNGTLIATVPNQTLLIGGQNNSITYDLTPIQGNITWQTCSQTSIGGRNCSFVFLFIRNTAPNQTSPILNSSKVFNTTNYNATLYNQTVNATWGNLTNIVNWYKNFNSFQFLNLPFEYGSNSTYTKDYSPYNLTGNVSGGATWLPSSGPFGDGSYYFQALAGNRIQIPNDNVLNFTKNFSIALWAFYDVNVSYPQPLFVRQTLNGNLTDGYGILVYNSTAAVFYVNSLAPESSAVGSLDLGWNHIVATYDGRTLKLYVNRNLVSLVPYTAPLIGSDGPAVMGESHYFFDYYYNGYLSDVQVFGDAITQEQVSKIFYNGSELASTILNLGDVWQGCITPNDESGDGNYECSNNLTILPDVAPTQDNPILNSSSPFNFTNADLTVYPINTTDFENDTIHNYINWYVNSSSIMTLYLPIDGPSNSSFTRDYSGRVNIVSIPNLSYLRVNGHDGFGAYEISPSSSGAGASTSYNMYINQTNVSQLFPPEFTFSFWANPGPVSDRPTFGFNDSGFLNVNNPFASYDIALTFTDGSSVQTMSPLPTAPGNEWTHYVVRSNSTHYTIFVNGTQYATTAKTVNVSYSTLRDFIIGNSGFNTGMAFLNPYLGKIDDIRIYNLALTTEQIQNIYAGNDQIMDSTMLVNGATWQACVTPNDNILSGTTNCSGNATIHSIGNVSLFAPTNGSYYNGNTWFSYVNFSVTNPVLSALVIRYLNTTIYTTVLNTSPIVNDNLNFIDFTFNLTNNFTWAVCYADNASNIICSEEWNVQSDLIPPNMTVIVPINGTQLTTQAINASINATDGESGIAYCVWQILPAAIPVVVNCSAFTIPNANLHPGENIINFTAVDNMGNYNSTNVSVFVSAGDFRIDSPLNGSYINITDVLVPINLTIYNDTITAFCLRTINGGIPVNYDCSNVSIIQGSFNPGWNLMDINLTAINGISVNHSVMVFFDNTRPHINITFPVNFGTVNQIDFNLTTNVTDNQTAISQCWYSLNGNANTTFNCTFALPPWPGPGFNNLYVYANDSAGNINYSFVAFTTVSSGGNDTYVSCDYRYLIASNSSVISEVTTNNYETVPIDFGLYYLLIIGLGLMCVLGPFFVKYTQKQEYDIGEPLF